jgi:hypothetical protein
MTFDWSRSLLVASWLVVLLSSIVANAGWARALKGWRESQELGAELLQLLDEVRRRRT